MIESEGEPRCIDRFASSTVQSITGQPTYDGQDPVATLFSIVADPPVWHDQSLIWIPSVVLRSALGIYPGFTHVSLHELERNPAFRRMIESALVARSAGRPPAPLESEAWNVLERAVVLRRLLRQELRIVPPPFGGRQRWLPISNPSAYTPMEQQRMRTAWIELLTMVRTGQLPMVDAAVERLAESLNSRAPAPRPVTEDAAQDDHGAILVAAAVLAIILSLWRLRRRVDDRGPEAADPAPPAAGLAPPPDNYPATWNDDWFDECPDDLTLVDAED